MEAAVAANTGGRSHAARSLSGSGVSSSATPGTAARQVSLSITNSRSSLKLTSIESVMPSSYLISVIPFSSRLHSFPASGSFPMSQFLSGGQRIGVSASASVLWMNIQDWFPLGLTGLTSLQSKGLSSVFSSTTVQQHQFFSAPLTLWSISHIHHMHLTHSLIPTQPHLWGHDDYLPFEDTRVQNC